jgi:hypothetical protein
MPNDNRPHAFYAGALLHARTVGTCPGPDLVRLFGAATFLPSPSGRGVGGEGAIPQCEPSRRCTNTPLAPWERGWG